MNPGCWRFRHSPSGVIPLKKGVSGEPREAYCPLMSVDDFVRARDRILRAVDRELGVDPLLGEVIRALHDVADFSECAVVLTDPDTLLPFGGVVEGLASHSCVPFWDNELRDPDFAKFNALARSSDPVASLYEATDGELTRSPRFQKLYEHLGVGDELRVAFRSGQSCWAVGWMIRREEAGPFGAQEMNDVRNLVPVAARAISGAVTRRSGDHAGTGPAMLVVDAAGEIESMTAEAEALLPELRTHGLDDIAAPTAVVAAARRAIGNRSSTTTALRARCSSGRWLKLHASPLGTDGRVAVMIETASRSDLVPILLESYGLTQRESHVVLLLARGFSTKDIAAELNISRHTVHDHIKAIYAKCGVSSRGELVAGLFTNHLHAAHEAAVGYVA